MALTITLDWLAMTFKEHSRDEEKFCALYASAPQVADVPARNGYKSAYADKNGVVRMWNLDREEMGQHVIFNGSALRNIFERKIIRQRDLVEAAVNAGASITRLDLAKDATNVDCNLAEIWNDIKAGKKTGASRTFSTIESDDGKRTIYIGSRVSERFARIYDKRGQLGYEGVSWYRYELETKGMVARALASLLVREENWSCAFDKMSLDMLDMQHNANYQEFFTAGAVQIGIPKIEKQSDREKWIMTQVVKAVIEHYSEHPDSPAVQFLIDALAFQNGQQGSL